MTPVLNVLNFYSQWISSCSSRPEISKHSHISSIWKKRGVCQGWNAECALEKIWSVCVLTGGQHGVLQQPVVWPKQQLQASIEQIIDLDKYQVVGCALLAECGFRVITLKKKRTWLFSRPIRHLTIGVMSQLVHPTTQGLFTGQVKSWLNQAAQILIGISSVFSIQFR